MTDIRTRSPYAGCTVKVKCDSIKDPLSGIEIGGRAYEVEDWWENVYGESWMFSNGNPAALSYAFRAGLQGLPADNDVLYGKIDGLGFLVHVTEIDVKDVD